jgi:prevent-host-death family protein
VVVTFYQELIGEWFQLLTNGFHSLHEFRSMEVRSRTGKYVDSTSAKSRRRRRQKPFTLQSIDLHHHLDPSHRSKPSRGEHMRIPVSEAKGQLSKLVKHAEAGDEVVLTRHGQPAVRLVPIRPTPNLGARRKLLEAVRISGVARATPGPDAARSQDFLYGNDFESSL